MRRPIFPKGSVVLVLAKNSIILLGAPPMRGASPANKNKL